MGDTQDVVMVCLHVESLRFGITLVLKNPVMSGFFVVAVKSYVNREGGNDSIPIQQFSTCHDALVSERGSGAHTEGDRHIQIVLSGWDAEVQGVVAIPLVLWQILIERIIQVVLTGRQQGQTKQSHHQTEHPYINR